MSSCPLSTSLLSLKSPCTFNVFTDHFVFICQCKLVHSNSWKDQPWHKGRFIAWDWAATITPTSAAQLSGESTPLTESSITLSEPGTRSPFENLFGSPFTLSKKRSQEKSYEVRGQSDVCHTSVMFMPAFPWHQMGGEFSHRLVSTLSYILHTCLCQEFSKWFIFFLNFPVCMCYLQLCVPMHVNNFNAVCSSLLKLWHHVEFWISVLGNSLFFPPTTSKRAPTCKSMNSLLPWWTASSLDEQPPLSLDKQSPQWMASPLSWRMASCLSRQTASPLSKWPPASLNRWPPLLANGLLPLSTDGLPSWWMASPLGEWPPLLVNGLPSRWMASPLGEWPPLSVNGSSLPQWTAFSLSRWMASSLPWWTASCLPQWTVSSFAWLMGSPPSTNSFPPPSTNSLILPLMNSLRQMALSLPQWMVLILPLTNGLPPPSTNGPFLPLTNSLPLLSVNDLLPALMDSLLPWQMLSSRVLVPSYYTS